MVYLILLALLPAFVLCCYTYLKDRVEKEPLGLLGKLFLLGALSCFPAASLEGILEGVVENIFYPVLNTNLYNFIYYVFAIALVEEGLKWLILVLETSENENFNCTYDGLIYAIFVSLGFAALENILYVTNNGVTVGILRAVLSVPGHMFFAVFMGIYYSEWQLNKKIYKIEKILKKQGYIKYLKSAKYKIIRFLSLFVPVIIHGFYNHCCTTTDSPGGWIIFLGLMVFLYIKGFGKIRKMSASDGYTSDVIKNLLIEKYPEISIENIDDILFL